MKPLCFCRIRSIRRAQHCYDIACSRRSHHSNCQAVSLQHRLSCIQLHRPSGALLRGLAHSLPCQLQRAMTTSAAVTKCTIACFAVPEGRNLYQTPGMTITLCKSTYAIQRLRQICKSTYAIQRLRQICTTQVFQSVYGLTFSSCLIVVKQLLPCCNHSVFWVFNHRLLNK